MALNFPNSPTDGQLYTDTASGNRWTWDNANTVWKSTSTFTQTITVSSTQPGSPVVGQLWWSKDYGRLFVYYDDGNSTQWVEANPADQTAGLVFNTANAAYGKANTALQNTSGTFAGTLNIAGNVSIGTSTVPSDVSVIQTSNTKLEITAPGQRRIYSLGPTTSNYLLNSSGGAAILFDRLASASDELAFETHHQGTSHAERMRITKEGYVKTPYQPMFCGTISDGGGWRNFSSTWTIIKMNNILLNQGSFYNSTSGNFTCPVAGVYKVSIWYLGGNGGSQSNFSVYKNGSQYLGNIAHINMNGTSAWMTSGLTIFVSCAASDTIAGYGYSGASTFYTSDNYTGMTIEFSG